jgi:hypothetical protein
MTTEPCVIPHATIVWYDAVDRQWRELRWPQLPPCDNCAGEVVEARCCRTLCVGSVPGLHLIDREIPCCLNRLQLSHREYVTRQILLDEVAAYSAARLLLNRFEDAIARAPAAGAVAREIDWPRFASFAAVVDNGRDAPLRRLDSANWTTPVQELSARQEVQSTLWCDAFTHYSWSVASRKRAAAQILTMVGSYVVTAAVHLNTDDISEPRTFGQYNGGRVAIARFLGAHQCSRLCKALHLEPATPLS